MEIIMRNLCFLLTLVATLLLPGRLIAAALPQDEKLITGQLDNGLRYMIYPHAHPKDQVDPFVVRQVNFAFTQSGLVLHTDYGAMSIYSCAL